jgi:hypothetical protein
MTRRRPSESDRWVIDPYYDKIYRKSFADATRKRWGSDFPIYAVRFSTETEAVQALLKRAEDRVAAAEREAEKERDRLKRLRKKYGTKG